MRCPCCLDGSFGGFAQRPGRTARPSRRLSKTVYRATDANAGQAALEAFAEGPRGAKYPPVPRQ